MALAFRPSSLRRLLPQALRANGFGGGLASRLLLPLGFAGCALMLAIGGVAFALAWSQAEQALAASAAQAAANADAFLIRHEIQLLADARELGSRPSVRAALEDGQVEALQAELTLAQRGMEVPGIAVLDRFGRPVAELGLPPGLARETRVWPTAEQSLHATGFEWGPDSAWLLVAARVVDRTVGVVVIVGRPIDEAFLDALAQAAGAPVALRFDGRTAGADVATDSARVQRGLTGVGQDVALLIDVPLSAHRAAMELTITLIAVTGAATLAMFLALSVLVVRRVSRPLRDLAAVATAVEAGDHSRSAPTDGPNEVAATARAFNRMVAAVAEREEQLRVLYAEAKKAAAAMERQALHDILTDLPNRVLLDDRLRQSILNARRQDKALALLVLDLDHFKEVNDTFGHSAGDELLRQVGARVRAQLREIDTIARLGGDEFAVILPEADEHGATLVARRILEASEAPFAVEGQGLDVRASIGIALYPEHGEDAETLLRRADIAMYAAKRSGEGCATYSRERDGDGLNSLVLTADLRRAMAENGLLVHYQPQVSFKTGEVTGFEALVRWQHPQRGLLSPSDFISLAERTGLIKRLTDAVLETAFADCRAWRAVGYPLPVAVNLSTRNLLDLDFADSVAALLAKHGLSPEWLTLEITEGVLMLDPVRALQMLSRVRELGVRLSVDDFGTGYSSLSYLHGMRIDEVKIDKSFIAGGVSEESSAAIVRSIIDLGHSLGVEVIAEGVEDAAAWELLRGLGCDGAQGFYVGHPMAFGDLIKWLEAAQWKPPSQTRALGA